MECINRGKGTTWSKSKMPEVKRPGAARLGFPGALPQRRVVWINGETLENDCLESNGR